MPKFSNTSKSRLDTCHKDLRMIFDTVISHFDCSILEGHRSEADQNEAYQNGKSQLKFPQSKHNKMPSMAVDVAPYPIDWTDRERFCHFAGYVIGVADMLHGEGLISHRVRWGGNWDRDGILSDNNFDDLPHFELVT